MASLLHQAALAARYVRYYFTAGTRHGLHAPFVYELYEQVICHPGPFGAWGPIEARRRALQHDTRQLTLTDFGAGPGAALAAPPAAARVRRVADVARTAAKPAKYGQLLFRLVNHFRPAHLLELGTSLGLSAAYLAAPHSRNRLLTLEGDPASAAIARETFQKLGIRNAEVLVGEFDQTLPTALARLGGRLDFVFFDGNHRYEPTMRYVRACLPARHEGTVFVVDDINWSEEMGQAWAEIQALPEVTLTIDLFFVGLVFFRPNAPKQHFTLRY